MDLRRPSENLQIPNKTSMINNRTWVEKTFKKLDCSSFIPSTKNPDRCNCGKPRDAHQLHLLSTVQDKFGKHPSSRSFNRWSITRNTIALPTDAYGTIEFLSGPHPYKAQYIKLAYNTDPADVLHLLEHVWQLTPPKLIISVHGGHKNFDLQPSLARCFRNGLIKAAKSTNAWIITPGFDSGVVKHISSAFEPIITISRAKSKVVTIGIAPWGLLHRREDLIGKNTNVFYHPQSLSGKSKYYELNNRHNYYLLVDDGTIGKRRLESFIMEKRTILEGSDRSVPVVGISLEGGLSLIRTVNDYVKMAPKVPVVICDGSGRASDLLAFAHQHINEHGKLPENVYPQFMDLIRAIFDLDKDSGHALIKDILSSVMHKNMVTIFRMENSQQQEFDYSILIALHKGHNLSAYEQLMLALAWNRADIAKTEIFKPGVELAKDVLYDAMMEALMQNKVEFVRLLLEKGVDMKNFLTIKRLEDLYNSDQDLSNTLHCITNDILKVHKGYRYNLPDIGLVIERLIKHGYRSRYTTKEFKEQYNSYKKELKETLVKNNGITKAYSDAHIINPSIDNHDEPKQSNNKIDTRINMNNTHIETSKLEKCDGFLYPFSDLFVWAVLTQRQDLAICMWEHGEEALAKALIGMLLYKSLARSIKRNYYGHEICLTCTELQTYSEEFHNRALELLDLCFKHDDSNTLQLLTYELSYWGNTTCLSLAVLCHSKAFLAHPCCQTILSDLWRGGLQIRRHINLNVIMGLICPFYIFFLDFKSKEELMLQPQTATEHNKYINLNNESTSPETSPDEWEPEDDEAYKTKSRRPTSNKIWGSLDASETQHNHYTTFFRKVNNRLNLPVENINQPKLESLENPSTANNHKKRYARRRPIEVSTIHKTLSDTELSRKTSFANYTQNQGLQFTKKKQIKWHQKLYEFFVAPITTFWSWTLSYIVFMMVFIYVLLVRTPLNPSIYEWYLFSYVGSIGLELLRRFIISAPNKFTEKWDIFFDNFWNTLTTMAVTCFLIGFGLRLETSLPIGTSTTYYISLKKDISRIILAVDSVLWVMKMLDFLSIHPRLGPYITAAGKMILNSVYVIMLLAIALLAFGLPRQSISFPNEDWHWILIRNIFYKPYFMVYGEVYAEEIDRCDDDSWENHVNDGVPLSEFNQTNSIYCVPGYWIPPILMTVFLIISTFLLLSMLIATFNQTFDGVRRIANQVWLFQRYNQVIQYECTPCISPPFTPIYYVYMLVRYISYKYKFWHTSKLDLQKRNGHPLFEWSLKLYLPRDQIKNLHDFEEECMYELSLTKESEKTRSTDERIKRTSEKTDAVYIKLNNIECESINYNNRLIELENKIQNVDNKQTVIIDYLAKLTKNHEMKETTIEDNETLPEKPIEYEDLLSPLQNFHRGRRHRTTSSDDEVIHSRGHEYKRRSFSFLDPNATINLQKPSTRKTSIYTSITDDIDVRKEGHDEDSLYTTLTTSEEESNMEEKSLTKLEGLHENKFMNNTQMDTKTDTELYKLEVGKDSL